MKRVWVLALAALVLAGCGATRHVTTVGRYGPYPAQTITGSADPKECALDAHTYARDALAYLAHSGPDAAYPADLYYMMLREDFADFGARGCDPKLLGSALRARLTASQRATLVGSLPTAMADAVRNAG